MSAAVSFIRWTLATLVTLNAIFGLISVLRLAVAKQQDDPVLSAVMSWPLLANYAAELAVFILASCLAPRQLNVTMTIPSIPGCEALRIALLIPSARNTESILATSRPLTESSSNPP